MFIASVDGQPALELVPLARALNARPAGEAVELGVSVFRRMGPFLRRQDGAVRVTLR
jgi:hypothetical protein